MEVEEEDEEEEEEEEDEEEEEEDEDSNDKKDEKDSKDEDEDEDQADEKEMEVIPSPERSDSVNSELMKAPSFRIDDSMSELGSFSMISSVSSTKEQLRSMLIESLNLSEQDVNTFFEVTMARNVRSIDSIVRDGQYKSILLDLFEKEFDEKTLQDMYETFGLVWKHRLPGETQLFIDAIKEVAKISENDAVNFFNALFVSGMATEEEVFEQEDFRALLEVHGQTLSPAARNKVADFFELSKFLQEGMFEASEIELAKKTLQKFGKLDKLLKNVNGRKEKVRSSLASVGIEEDDLDELMQTLEMMVEASGEESAGAEEEKA